jgi:hypothetical protein
MSIPGVGNPYPHPNIDYKKPSEIEIRQTKDHTTNLFLRKLMRGVQTPLEFIKAGEVG